MTENINKAKEELVEEELPKETAAEEEPLNINLKRASSEDIPTLIDLEEKVAGTKLYSPMLTQEEWQEAFDTDKIFLVELDGKVVGEISYEMKNPEHAYISGLVIDPAIQGRGLGRRTMELILQELQGVARIDLVVHPKNTNAKEKIYKELGFEEESKMENYFGDGEPRIKMVLKQEHPSKTDEGN